MKLHNEIMNIPTPSTEGWAENIGNAYKEGYRDARHAAAEIAMQGEAEIEALKDSFAIEGAKCDELSAQNKLLREVLRKRGAGTLRKAAEKLGAEK